MKLDRRIQKTRTAMKEALLTLMEEKDFPKITITDIVSVSNINRGTFYKHYESKEELFNDLINDVLRDLILSYEKPFENTNHFHVKNLTSSAIHIFEHAKRHSRFYKILFTTSTFPDLDKKIIQIFRTMAIQDLLASNNHIEAPDPQILADFSAYGLYGLLAEWVKGGFVHSPEYMAGQLLKILSFDFQQIVIDTSKRREEWGFIN